MHFTPGPRSRAFSVTAVNEPYHPDPPQLRRTDSCTSNSTRAPVYLWQNRPAAARLQAEVIRPGDLLDPSKHSPGVALDVERYLGDGAEACAWRPAVSPFGSAVRERSLAWELATACHCP